MKRRILSIITALALCLSLCPTWAFAVEGEPDTGLCVHHPEHTAECSCDTLCTEGTINTDCPVCGKGGADLADCKGEADAATVESVQEMIDTLPGRDEITEGNAEEVKAQLTAIDEAKAQLTYEEREQLDFSRYMEAIAALERLYGAATPSNAVMLVDYNGPAIMLGASSIPGYNNGYHYIYYGTWNDSPIKWRVLDTKTNTGADGLFLLSDVLLGTGTWGDVSFNSSTSDRNAWQGSKAQTWCKNFYTDNILSGEHDAVLPTTKSDGAYSSFAASENILNGDTVFFLSAEEANNSKYGFTDDTSRIANYGSRAGVWWLRSPHADYVAYASTVGSAGDVDKGSVAGKWSARPAFNLNLESVLFTSAAAGGKGGTGLTAIDDYTGSEWKLTLTDNNNFATGASFDGDTNVAAGQNLTITHAALSSFSGANYTNVTAALIDSSGNLLYYGSVNTDSSATSSTVTIPEDLALGTYTLSFYGEQWNGANETDYATGTPYTTTITVAQHTHSLTLVDAKAPTCTVPGNTAYYTCSCGKWFSDVDATTEITNQDSVILPVTEHTASDSDWGYDATNHWQVCTVCNTEIDGTKAAHTWGDVTEGHGNSCTVCGYAVAKIGEVGYGTLQAAFNAVADGQTITLLQNVTANITTKADSVSYTFDLNGCTLSSTMGYTLHHSSAGTLTITDSSTDGSGKVVGAQFVVYNSSTGSIVVSGGTVSTAHQYGIAIANGGDGNIEVTGGTVSATGADGTAIINATGGILISGGTVLSTGANTWTIDFRGTGNLTMTGGEVSAAGTAIGFTSTGAITIDGNAVVEGKCTGNDGTIYILGASALEVKGNAQVTNTAGGYAVYFGHPSVTGDNVANYYTVADTAAVGKVYPKANLKNDWLTLDPVEAAYNGQEQKPAVTVKHGGTTLTEGTDYTVAYSGDFTNAGDHTVTVTATESSNYSGSASTTFTINKADSTLGTPTIDKTSVTYGDTFTVTFTPTMLTQQGFFARMFSRAAVPAKRAQLYYGDTLIAQKIDVTADTEVTITVLANNVIPAEAFDGTPQTLTIQWGGDDKLNASTGTVKVTLNKKALTDVVQIKLTPSSHRKGVQ